jgi:NAD(P)H dehydrogenase (quinone)
MILVTGAGGKTGQAVIKALVKRGIEVRALVRRNEQIAMVKALGAVNVQTADILNPTDMRRAFSNVEAVYQICPNMHPEEIKIGEIAIQAAKAEGINHFVYHSVLHPHIESMPHHWNKLRVEEQLFKSDLSFTILQPAAYMQNVLAQWDSINKQGIYSIPYAVDTKLGMVDLDDVAEAAAKVLTLPGHEGAIYELAGSEIYTQNEIAELFGAYLQKPVIAKQIPLAEWKEKALATGMNEYAVSTLIQMFTYYEKFGFYGNPNVLSWLLGAPPTTFIEFIRRSFEQ